MEVAHIFHASPFIGGQQGAQYVFMIQPLFALGLVVDLHGREIEGSAGDSGEAVEKSNANLAGFRRGVVRERYSLRMEGLVAFGRFQISHFYRLGSEMRVAGVQCNGERCFPGGGRFVIPSISAPPSGEKRGNGFKVLFAHKLCGVQRREQDTGGEDEGKSAKECVHHRV